MELGVCPLLQIQICCRKPEAGLLWEMQNPSSVFLCTLLSALFTGLCLHATYSLHMIAKQSWKGFCSPCGSCTLPIILPLLFSPPFLYSFLKPGWGNGNSFVSQCSCPAKLLEWLQSLYGQDKHPAGIAHYIWAGSPVLDVLWSNCWCQQPLPTWLLCWEEKRALLLCVLFFPREIGCC